MKKLSLIVPCYNEAPVLQMFYKETTAVVNRLEDAFDIEFVFVDDGSTDSTLQTLVDLAEKDPRIKYISFSRNFGKEAAMLAGMEYAVRADYIGIMDADLQHSPDILPVMLKAVHVDGYDVAAARRDDREGEAKFKSGLSNAFYGVINKISDTKISNSAQDFRIMKQKVVESIIAMPESIRFSKGIFSWVGFNVKWISHENRERAAGETKWSIRKLAKYALDGILGFTTSPLRLSLFAAAVCALISFGDLLYALIKNGVNEFYQPVLPLVLAAIFFVGALILVAIGVAGEYIGRIYTEVKGRPKYIVSKSNIR